ncbi:hypothetical protein ACJX0J_014486, partial [Zea mays]
YYVCNMLGYMYIVMNQQTVMGKKLPFLLFDVYLLLIYFSIHILPRYQNSGMGSTLQNSVYTFSLFFGIGIDIIHRSKYDLYCSKSHGGIMVMGLWQESTFYICKNSFTLGQIMTTSMHTLILLIIHLGSDYWKAETIDRRDGD